MFSAPQNATEVEYRQLLLWPDARPIEDLRAKEEARDHDDRWVRIYHLYSLRHDKEGMALAHAQIHDRRRADSVAYRDIFTPEDMRELGY